MMTEREKYRIYKGVMQDYGYQPKSFKEWKQNRKAVA